MRGAASLLLWAALLAGLPAPALAQGPDCSAVDLADFGELLALELAVPHVTLVAADGFADSVGPAVQVRCSGSTFDVQLSQPGTDALRHRIDLADTPPLVRARVLALAVSERAQRADALAAPVGSYADDSALRLELSGETRVAASELLFGVRAAGVMLVPRWPGFRLRFDLGVAGGGGLHAITAAVAPLHRLELGGGVDLELGPRVELGYAWSDEVGQGAGPVGFDGGIALVSLHAALQVSLGERFGLFIATDVGVQVPVGNADSAAPAFVLRLGFSTRL